MWHRLTVQDITFIVAGVLCAGFLALEYDVFSDEGIVAAKKQRLELNEILSLGALLTVGLVVFSWRRMREYKRELMRRIAAEASAHVAARHDSLTGLPNRRRFTEQVRDALARASSQGSRLAVLFIDLDGFKPVNDTFGHAVGDALLVTIADRLRRCVPDSANVARLGGDEFAALIEFEHGPDSPALAAARILREIGEPIANDGKDIRVGATVGVAIWPSGGRRAEDLIHAADLAMYEGKQAGRGTVRIFEAA